MKGIVDNFSDDLDFVEIIKSLNTFKDAIKNAGKNSALIQSFIKSRVYRVELMKDRDEFQVKFKVENGAMIDDKKCVMDVVGRLKDV